MLNHRFAWFSLSSYYIILSVPPSPLPPPLPLLTPSPSSHSVILTSSLADPSFNLNGIKYFNTVINYYYIACLIASFLLALGNRPAGAKIWYLVIAVSYAVITVYMLVSWSWSSCALLCRDGDSREGATRRYDTSRLVSLTLLDPVRRPPLSSLPSKESKMPKQRFKPMVVVSV